MLLAPLLALTLAASTREASADEIAFLGRLRRALPMTMQTAEGFGPPDPGKVAVSMPEPMVLLFSGEGVPTQRLTFTDNGGRLQASWGDRPPLWDLEEGRCHAELTQPDRMDIECFSVRAMRSRARLPPAMVISIYLTPDGPRIVRQGPLRVVYSPWGRRQRIPGVEPGGPAVLADALRQLAAWPAAPGMLGGGSSNGRGDWFSTTLKLTDVKGLDFKLQRVETWERAGSARVRVGWSFDYQGQDARDRSILVWRVRRTRDGARPLDLWCLGRPHQGGLKLDCHGGAKPDPGRTETGRAVGFLLMPFPEWRLNVLEGRDEAFGTAGNTRLEPLPFP